MCWRDNLSNEEWWENYRHEQLIRRIIREAMQRSEKPLQRVVAKPKEKPKWQPTDEEPF
jgi:hypothetical protein